MASDANIQWTERRLPERPVESARIALNKSIDEEPAFSAYVERLNAQMHARGAQRQRWLRLELCLRANDRHGVRSAGGRTRRDSEVWSCGAQNVVRIGTAAGEDEQERERPDDSRHASPRLDGTHDRRGRVYGSEPRSAPPAR